MHVAHNLLQECFHELSEVFRICLMSQCCLETLSNRFQLLFVIFSFKLQLQHQHNPGLSSTVYLCYIFSHSLYFEIGCLFSVEHCYYKHISLSLPKSRAGQITGSNVIHLQITDINVGLIEIINYKLLWNQKPNYKLQIM